MAQTGDPGPSWSRRNGAQYRRLCARAGCGAPAVATLRFQSTQRRAWLGELDDNAARTQGDLCNRHAAALVLPRGWELHDQRNTEVPAGADTSAAVAELAPKTGKGSRRVRVRRPKVAADTRAEARPLPGLETPPVTPLVDANPAEVDAALDAILDARTPLLQRAFRNVRPD